MHEIRSNGLWGMSAGIIFISSLPAYTNADIVAVCEKRLHWG
jgi:hypothetical protein